MGSLSCLAQRKAMLHTKHHIAYHYNYINELFSDQLSTLYCLQPSGITNIKLGVAAYFTGILLHLDMGFLNATIAK